ncbi:MAG: RsmE family RNA methyltransferase [Bacillota bacterium]
MGARERSLEQLNPCPHARFTVEAGAIRGDEVLFGQEAAWQMARVLRLGPGQVVGVMVEGRELAVRLEEVGPRQSRGRVLGPVDRFTEPGVTVAILQALLKGDRTDLVVQKATELGVSYIFPVITARTVVRPSASPGKLQRWEKIAREAAEQSLRTRVPAIFPPQNLEQALEQARQLLPGATLVVLWEEERKVGLCDVLAGDGKEIILLMGPEGGLTADEVAGVLALGGRSASLGTRILRSETAALAALTLVLASRGEIGRAPGGWRPGCVSS